MSERTVGIVGVGRLGSDIAFSLAERDLCNVVLFDQEPDRARYLAADLTDTSFGHVYNRRVSWVESLTDLSGSDVILITAGQRRTPGMTTTDLYRANRAVIHQLSVACSGSSALFVVCSEPVDLLTTELFRALNRPAARVMGIGGMIDSIRARSAIADATSLNPNSIRSHVVGSHGADAQILWDFSSINGVPIREVIAADVPAAVDQVFRSQAEARLQQMTESFSRYMPAVAAVELLRALVTDDRRILSVTVPWNHTLGIADAAMSAPVVVGRLGAERIVLPSLSKPTVAMLRDTAAKLEAIVQGAAQ